MNNTFSNRSSLFLSSCDLILLPSRSRH